MAADIHRHHGQSQGQRTLWQSSTTQKPSSRELYAVSADGPSQQAGAGRTTTVDVGGGDITDITGYLHDSWHFVGSTIIVPNEFWELPSGTSSCLITALIAAEGDSGYDYAVAFEDANNFHYRMSASQAKHLATKPMKKLASRWRVKRIT